MSDTEKCSPPLPPPPPVLLPSVLSNIEKNIEGDFNKLTQKDLDVALNRLLSLNENFSRIFHVSNTFLKPQLQDGPKCGLVALSIASSVNKNFTNVDKILQEATALNFTKQGEMFDANFLAVLAEKCCKFKSNIIEGGLNLHQCCIINNLLKKGLLLVPYDADHNHSPCCKKGFKAHWAVITGFAVVESISNHNVNIDNKEDKDMLITINSPDFSICNKCKSNNKDNDLDISLFNCQGKMLMGKKPIRDVKNIEYLSEGKIYLIGMQGKSKHIGVWSFEDMIKSNDNLVCFSPDRDFESYIVPEGGVSQGLKGKAVMLLFSPDV